MEAGSQLFTGILSNKLVNKSYKYMEYMYCMFSFNNTMVLLLFQHSFKVSFCTVHVYKRNVFHKLNQKKSKHVLSELNNQILIGCTIVDKKNKTTKSCL